jgi:hypothetical protein
MDRMHQGMPSVPILSILFILSKKDGRNETPSRAMNATAWSAIAITLSGVSPLDRLTPARSTRTGGLGGSPELLARSSGNTLGPELWCGDASAQPAALHPRRTERPLAAWSRATSRAYPPALGLPKSLHRGAGTGGATARPAAN